MSWRGVSVYYGMFARTRTPLGGLDRRTRVYQFALCDTGWRSAGRWGTRWG